MNHKFSILIFLLLIATHTISTEPEKLLSNFLQKDSISFFQNPTIPSKKRIHALNYSIFGLYGVSMTWLYSQWYKDYPQTSFHFFNDNSEWEQMDKYAHTWDAYNIAKPLVKCYQWTGMNKTKALVYGVGVAFLFQTSVEVFDGFSSQWGFSGGDMFANAIGLSLFTFQELKWQDQRLSLKFSFRQTKYADYRPDLFGKSLPENILKDYNGLTHWLSINPKSFFKNSNIPSWLSLAIGFGAEGMTGGKVNSTFYEGKKIPAFERYKQYYFSIDIELHRMQTHSKFLKSVFKLINIIHLPSPAIEFSKGHKPIFRPFYF